MASNTTRQEFEWPHKKSWLLAILLSVFWLGLFWTIMLLDIEKVLGTLEAYPVAIKNFVWTFKGTAFETIRALELTQIFLKNHISSASLFVMLIFDVFATHLMWKRQIKQGDISVPWDSLLLYFTGVVVFFNVVYILFVSKGKNNEPMFWFLQIIFVLSVCYKSLSFLSPDKIVRQLQIDVDEMG